MSCFYGISVCLLVLVWGPRALGQQQAITFNTNFDGASLGTIEKIDEATFRCHVAGQYDERGRNRQATWYFFRMDHAGGREVTITLTDFVGEYNDKPGSVAMSKEITPVVSEDGKGWRPADSMQWDAEKKEATIRVKAKGQTLWVAHQPPYTGENLKRVLAEVEQSPLARIEVIGKTVNGRELNLVTVTDPAVADEGKKTVWLIARQHAWESGTSWVMEGALRRMISNEPAMAALREKVVFRFVPMMDPDGVAGGKVRFNANGYDVNRHWDEVDLRSKRFVQLMPEIWYVKKAILAEHAARKIDLMLNLHNTETGEYLESFATDAQSKARMQGFYDRLVKQTTFDPHRPMGFSTGKTATTNVLYEQSGVPVMLMEQRIAKSPKLGRALGIADRVEFGGKLIEIMARTVLD